MCILYTLKNAKIYILNHDLNNFDNPILSLWDFALRYLRYVFERCQYSIFLKT